MVGRASQVAVLAVLGFACEAPARVKPWRHVRSATLPGTDGRLPDERRKQAPDEPGTGAALASGEGRRGHTLRIHVDTDPGRLAPRADVAPTVWARRITFGTIFESLVRLLPNGRYAPGLARSWQILPTGLAIRIDLQPNATFHDGRPLTAVDVQYTLDAVRDPRSAVRELRDMLDEVTAVELVSPVELRLRLRRPSGWVLRALAEIPILPMHIYDPAGANSSPNDLVGTGPWKWTSSKQGVVRLSRNAHYWGKQPAISELEFVSQRDAAVALTAARRGELDIIPALIPAHWPEQASAPSIVASFRSLQLSPPRFRYFAMNAARAPLDEPRVRKALSLLVDRRAIAKRVFGGLARPVLWPIWPGGPANGPEVAVPEFDPEAAGKLLDASGWIDSDKDGVRDQAGTPLRLVLVAVNHLGASESTEKSAAKVAASPVPALAPKSERDLFVEASRRSGVLIEVRTASQSAVSKWISEGQYDLVEYIWGGMSDGDIADVIARNDRAWPAQPRVIGALEAMRAAWNPDQRSPLISELATALNESWPIAGIVAEAPQGLVHNRLANVRVWNGWIDLSEVSFQPAAGSLPTGTGQR